MRRARLAVTVLVITATWAGCLSSAGDGERTDYRVEAEPVQFAPDDVTVLDANSSRVRSATAIREIVVDTVETEGRDAASERLATEDRYRTVREQALSLPHRTVDMESWDELVSVYVEYRDTIVRVGVGKETYTAE